MIRNKRLLRIISMTVIFALLNQVVIPVTAWALTSGPSQPEMQQFTPIGSTDYVDLFTGDFTYNIPLLDVEGFPINLAYHSGIAPDQEASWVGLGWNINPGVINRQMRGIPDDFDGDVTTQAQNVKPNITVGVKVGFSGEIVGWPLSNDNQTSNSTTDSIIDIGFSLGLSYNNYRKLGIDYGLNFSAAGSNCASFDIQNSNQGGLTLATNLATPTANAKKLSIGISAGINSREGMEDITLHAQQNIFFYRTGDNGTRTVAYKTALSPHYAFSFCKPVFYPSSDFPHENVSFSFTVKPVGGEIFAAFPNTSYTGYYYKENLKTNTQAIPSYGWLYEQNSTNDDNSLMDFEREKDAAFRQNSVSLAVPYATFDVFDVSGDEINGSYHVVRNDLGIFRDRNVKTTSLSASGGIDFGIGGTNHIGANINIVSSSSVSSGWDQDNLFKAKAPFTKVDSTTTYEPSYFKNAGEMTLNQGSMYNQTGGNYPAAVKLTRNGTTVFAVGAIQTKGVGSIPIATSIFNSGGARTKRQQVFSFLTAAEASSFGLEKNIRNYGLNKNPYLDCSHPADTAILRSRYPAHHISEITILKEDGKRYVYGIPVYNTYQKEVTFNVSGVGSKNNLVHYSFGEASIGNSNGKDHFYDAKIIPPYAHSYLLTGVLSADYQDNTGDGISPDDLGQAYKLNYSRVLREFKWRTPVQKDSATFNEGMKSMTYDDKGSFAYGKKEIWYLNSIESRNYIAVFYLLDRDDALGVTDSTGGVDTNHKLKKLDHIELYSKADLIKNKANATPIKSVYFEYDYSLCKGVPNQVNTSSGKLTLKDIYFTYGKSVRGKLNKYVFTYDDGSSYSNPKYSLTNNDRWGNLSIYKGTYAEKFDTLNFPYTVQDVTRANQLASAWTLKKINLPSSGVLNINYESDSYAYIQDKRAGQMIKILGFQKDSSLATFDNTLYGTLYINDFMFVKLPKFVHSREEFRQLYLDGLDYLYYQVLMNVNSPSNASNEYVKGYTKWINYGIKATSDSTNIAWLKLTKVRDEVIGKANPLSYAAWQYLRLNIPEKAYPGSDLSDNAPPMDYVWSVLSIIPNFTQLIYGFNNEARLNDKGKFVDTTKSIVRLDNPTFNKLGGGSRVKKITLSDSWSSMVATQPSYLYGQEYTYTKQDIDGRTISSGVASYEPIIGNEENPFRIPIFYEDKNALAPNNFFYTEEPLGESLFPAPIVGYSQVTVKNLSHTNVTVTGPGYTISKFYTARDFPVTCSHTDIDPELVKPNPIFKILNINVHKSMTASQGFVVEVNDMHGKPMEESVYNEMGALISSKRYHYKTDDDDARTKHLNNSCQVVLPTGSVTTQSIGIDVESYSDMRHQETDNNGGGAQFNTDVVAWIGLIPIPSLYPSFTNSQTLFRSSAITKLVKRYGILDKVTAIENGATVITENVLYDSETGNPLLTQVTNEFSDPIYKFSYPAHWTSPNMGFAYKNVGAIFKNVTFTNGVISGISSPSTIFTAGDEVGVFTRSLKSLKLGFPIAYATYVSGSLIFLAKDGKLFNSSGPVTIKIIRSGNRNMMSAPAGTVSSLVYPVTSSSITFNTSKKILNADATVYSELWRTQKNRLLPKCDSIAPPDTSCGKIVAGSIFNTNHFFSLQPEITVGQAFPSGCGALLEGANANQPFGLTTESVGMYPYKVTSTSQYPGFSTSKLPAYVSINSFLNITASLGNCTFYFVNTTNGPLPIPPAGYTYYSFKKPSNPLLYPLNTMLVYYSGPSAYYITGTSPQLVGYFYFKCLSCQNDCKTLAQNDTINPYSINMLDAWRLQKTFAYHDLRNPSLSQFTPSVQNDGSYSNFSPFYTYNSSLHYWIIDSTTGTWIHANQSTLYDGHGNEIESADALNIKSTAIYRYNHSLPTAVVHNSQLKQAANDNFEDYNSNLSCAGNTCDTHHWDFTDVASNKIDTTVAHTGSCSLKLSANDSVKETKTIVSDGSQVYTSAGNIIKVGSGGLIPEFSPTAGKYIFSAWVKVDTTTDTCYCKPYWGNLATITMIGSGAIFNFQPSGPVIEGWQRIQGEFTVASTDNSIKVKLRANPNNVTHFDDVRIFPSLGNMKSFVYDWRNLRLMATLDENNYATFYEYDEDGTLIRVKKETERGIATIQEGRTNLKTVQ